MSPKTYSSSEVAAKLKISRQTLYNWIEAGLIDAPQPIKAGGASIRIWTDAHIKAARKIKGTLKPGPQTGKKGGGK